MGDRLHTIYSTLQEKHDYVVLIGTDSPQLQPMLIANAVARVKQHQDSCVIGPAFDGGFYLFAAKRTILKTIWTQVTYSEPNTLKELTANLANHHIAIHWLSEQGDIDTVSDLKSLISILEANQNRLPAQEELYTWLQNQKQAIG